MGGSSFWRVPRLYGFEGKPGGSPPSCGSHTKRKRTHQGKLHVYVKGMGWWRQKKQIGSRFLRGFTRFGVPCVPQRWTKFKSKTKSSSREVSIRVSVFSVVYFSRGTLPKKKGKEKGTWLGDLDAHHKNWQTPKSKRFRNSGSELCRSAFKTKKTKDLGEIASAGAELCGWASLVVPSPSNPMSSKHQDEHTTPMPAFLNKCFFCPKSISQQSSPGVGV